MSKTVVGLFSSTAAAQQVKQALISEGFESSDITIHATDSDDYGDSGSSSTTGYSGTSAATSSGYSTGSSTGKSTSGTGTGIGEKISSFFQSLTGGEEQNDYAHQHYTQGVTAGGALLSVTTDDEDAAEVAALLKQHGARDIDNEYSQTAGGGVPVYSDKSSASADGTAIPIVEENLVVGKREVDRGGVRIYSRVVERPVEQDVTLREERVSVDRRAVDRPATEADFVTGRDASFEVRATGEEAVVGKNSRVVEEVRVGKEASQRTDVVRDTVRKTEVEVERIAGEDAVLTDDVTTSKSRY